MAYLPTGLRITPAYAGQIGQKLDWSILDEDHPRIRGTNFNISTCYKTAHRGFGITPAYAGQMFGSFAILHSTEDHPRIRGTNLPIRQ